MAHGPVERATHAVVGALSTAAIARPAWARRVARQLSNADKVRMGLWRLRGLVPHEPSLRQAAFLSLDHMEAFFGGAAGGGKSDALLMGALMYVHEPGYAALILRRTYSELSLPDALMPRAHEWLDGKAKWDKQEKTWTFPSGATLTFGYLKHEGDERRYKGAAFDYIAFDEVTEFSLQQYRYLFSRLRRLIGSVIPSRIRSSGNPDGPHVAWVKERFVARRRSDRPFIPSRLQDNPGLDRDAYIASLMHLDPVTRARLLDGDWEIRPPGRYFDRGWLRFDDESLAPPGAQRIRWWDFAATEENEGKKRKEPDWTVGLLLSTFGDELVIEDVVRGRWSPGSVEQKVLATAALDGPDVLIGLEQEPGSSGKFVVADFKKKLRGYAVLSEQPTGSKTTRARAVSTQAELGHLRILRRPWTEVLVDELESFPGPHDDQVDALSGAYRHLLLGDPTAGPVEDKGNGNGHRRDGAARDPRKALTSGMRL